MRLQIDLGRERRNSRITEFKVTIFLMTAMFALALALMFSHGTPFGL